MGKVGEVFQRKGFFYRNMSVAGAICDHDKKMLSAKPSETA